ncbi:MAG: bifunctional metallophosphatase/5'-nucleotidase [Oligoflexia bacterium]|nr:bifunctional metallophosphatase/5'-nucleotidase [Oligoflexia bacterium]
MKGKVWFFISLIFFWPTFGRSEILQILHTNDLHSYWQDDEARTGRAGFSRIKAFMDLLEADGNQKGWHTVKLDAGDFSEGSINYLARQGDVSFELMHQMGFDAVTLGNHDYLTGPGDLKSKQHRRQTQLPLIAANIDDGDDLMVAPGLIIYRGKLRIAVGGATTDSPLYKWALEPAKITDPDGPLENWLSLQRNADLRIALTHIGLPADRKLAKSTRYIDLIIGGHSHTVMDRPEYVLNDHRRLVPIVQTGAHGRFLGRLVLDIMAPGQYRILDYQVLKIPTHEDLQMSLAVKSGLKDLQSLFPVALTTPISFSEKKYYTHYEGAPIIGNLLADSIREATNSDVAYDSGQLYGELLPEGPITLYDSYELTPHVYDWNKSGWTLRTCTISGFSLKMIFQIGALSRTAMYVSGAEFRVNGFFVTDVKVAGRPIEDSKNYKLVMSEGLSHGTNQFFELDSKLCFPWEETGILTRDAVASKIMKTPIINDKVLGPRRIHGLTSKNFKCHNCPYPKRNPPY